MAWRFVVLTSAGGTRAWTLDSVDRLRAAHRWAAQAYRRHEIDDYQWWALPPEPPDKACPGCGYEYAPGRSRTDLCRCGHVHFVYQCPRCAERVDPPRA